MIQIRKLREFIPKGQDTPAKYDSPLSPDLVFDNIDALMEQMDKTINEIPESERYNLFCTLHNQPNDPEARKKKVWGQQDLIMFDIDGIPHDREAGSDEKYLEVLADVIGTSKESILQILSGGGYHFVVRLKNPIKDVSFFETNRIFYQVLCSRINDRLRDMSLQGVADAAVFAPNRMFRLPLTLNIKPDRPKVWVKLLHSHLEPIDLDLQRASGLPLLTEKDFMSERELSFLKVDSGTIESGCEFLKWAKKSQAEMNEPQWYAMLSIIARLINGKEKVHEYSKFHPSYSEANTDRKAEQSLGASGPRTCDNINSLWKGCSKCVHYKKLRSPIAIKGADFIATAHSGFHALNAKGALTPQYDDLKKYYNTKTPFKNVAKIHYRYMDQFWQDFSDDWIDNYAQQKFSPTCDNKKASEFRGLIKRSNLENPEFFSRTTDRYINLKNGILNIDTLELQPHSPDFGFKYLLDFDYDPSAEAPEFEQHLRDVTCDNESLQLILAEYMGYAISNDQHRAQKYLVLTGSGQNGKSTFLRIFRTLGGKGVTNLKPSQLSRPFYRQRLDGALFNIMEEVPAFKEKDFWEDLKDLTTDGFTSAEKKFKDVYEFQSKAKFVMTCNELPKGASPSHGFFRRLIIVPFEARFEGKKDDKYIAERIIKNEMSGVLNIVLKAYKRLTDNNYRFADSEAVTREIEAYKLDLDSVARWCLDHLDFGTPEVGGSEPAWVRKDSRGDGVAVTEEMFKEYASWCDALRLRPVAYPSFSKRLGRVFKEELRAMRGAEHSSKVARDKVRIDGVPRSVWRGVSYCTDASC